MSTTSALLDELALYLRPPGQGVHAVTTGRAERDRATRRYLGLSDDETPEWRRHLEGLLDLRGEDAVAILALPSDVGAGIRRGAQWGPQAIREALGTAPCFELGDVFSVPHLLDDASLSEEQKDRVRASIYPGVAAADRGRLPAGPLSIAERVYRILGELHPALRVLLVGGDHTVAWPAMAALLDPRPQHNADVAVVHFDAHTDLLSERLGVRYCFATWAWHANQRLGGGERIIQLGIRVSQRARGVWERTEEVRQVWADEAAEMTPDDLGALVVAHLRRVGAQRVYVSNDLDGTDPRIIPAVGTPEVGGLTPEQVVGVVDAVGAAGFVPLGADVVELAPDLAPDDAGRRRSAEVAARYLRSELGFLRSRGTGSVS